MTTTTKTKTATKAAKVAEPTIVPNDVYIKAFTTRFNSYLKTGKPFSANSFLNMKQRPWEPNVIGSLWSKLVNKHIKSLRILSRDRSLNPRSKGSRINVYAARIV